MLKMLPNPAFRRAKHLEMRASAEDAGRGSGVKGGGERLKVTIETRPEEVAALLHEITKAPQSQTVKMNWSPIKEGVDLETVKAKLTNGDTYDLIRKNLHKLY